MNSIMHLFWWALYAQSYNLATVTKTEKVYYNDLALDGTDSNGTIMTISKIDGLYDSPDRDYEDYPRASLPWGWLIEAIDRRKPITIYGTVRATTSSLLEQKLNEINKFLRENEKDLYIKVDDVYRVAKATNQKISYPREHYHISFCEFIITFQVLEPYFHKRTREENIYESITTSPYTANFDNNWYAPSFPEYVLSFRGSSAVTVIAIATNWYTITITKSSGSRWAWDQIRVNWKTMVVTENWTEIAYDWLITELPTGNNNVVFTFTGMVECEINILFEFNYR